MQSIMVVNEFDGSKPKLAIKNNLTRSFNFKNWITGNPPNLNGGLKKLNT